MKPILVALLVGLFSPLYGQQQLCFSRCERQGYCGYGIHCIVFAQYSQYFCRRSSQLHGGGSWVSVGTLRHSDPHDRPSYFCGKADVNFKRGQTVPLRVILPAPIRRI